MATTPGGNTTVTDTTHSGYSDGGHSDVIFQLSNDPNAIQVSSTGTGDTIYSGTGNDSIGAHGTNDSVSGGGGNDQIDVSQSVNVMVDGGTGNDHIGGDSVTGGDINTGSGHDTVSLTHTTDTTVDLSGGSGS